jgi:two-component system, OmpR family, sensor histidine kinase BaeS
VARRGLFGLGGLWLRLALAFLGVSLIAVVVDTVLVATGITTTMTTVARHQEAGLAQSAAFASGAAYRDVGWARVDLRPVFDLAARVGAAVQIRDQSGRVVGQSLGYSGYPTAGQRTLPIVAARHYHSKIMVRVGKVTVRFGPLGFGAMARRFEAVRLRTRLLAAAIAALSALAVSVIIARLILTPIEVMLEAMRARTAGDRGYRITNVRAPGALNELLEGFNSSADAFDAMDRAQRNLVADLAHEVRTPVAVLQAETEAMIDRMIEPTEENLESLHGEVLRLGRMVDGLQRLAAAESAGVQLKLRSCDLAEITADVAERLDEAFAAAQVTVTTTLEPAVALCDYDRIQDVISNLLTNALKFTPPGGRVTVRTERRGDHQAILRISDTGIGIPGHELPHVTERFFRSKRSAGKVGGSGIGMAIVSELIRAHHGQLTIWSEEGQGTQVTVMLPTTGY